MRIPLKIIHQETIDAYNLTAHVDNQGWIYMHIKKGMYGLKEVSIIANQEFLNIWIHFDIIPCNTHLAYESMTTDTPFLALWSKTFVFNIPQQRMPTIFKCPQSQISNHSRYGSKSLHWN